MGENLTCQMCGAKLQSREQLDAHNKKEHPQMSETIAAGEKKKL